MTNTTPCTWIGSTGYRIDKGTLATIRKMAKAAKTDWKAIAARPALAQAWAICYEQAGGNLSDALARVLAKVEAGTMPC